MLILFPDEWLAYSPTVINLLRRLQERHDVAVAAIDTGKYRRLEAQGVEYLRVNLHLARALELLGLYKAHKARLLRRALARFAPDEVIAVDSVGAWAAQSSGRTFHYLSLEAKQDGFLRRLSLRNVKSVLVQSMERYRYLFGDAPLRVHLVHNAPVFRGPAPARREHGSLIFLGNAIAKHGVFHCAEFIKRSTGFKLTIKGNIPGDVRCRLEAEYAAEVANGRLTLDDAYVQDDDIPAYLGAFFAGFCLYDLAAIDPRDFNYLSAPSGKLFNYYAAGVPVVASDMLGLKSVKELDTGVALQALTVEAITEALTRIDNRHAELVENCYRAARHFDFDTSVEPFLAEL